MTHNGASDTGRAGLHVVSNLKAVDKTVGLDGLTKLAGGMNDRWTSGMQSGLRRLARRLADGVLLTSREELEAVIAGQPTTKKQRSSAATTRLGWISDGHEVDTKQTMFVAAYMGVAAAVDVMLVATALGSGSGAEAAGGGGLVEERIGALSAEALKAGAMQSDGVADGDKDVAGRLMSVVRWRSRQQQQQQAHQPTDEEEAAVTDRAALLRALSVAAARGNEAMAVRLMVVVNVTTQQQDVVLADAAAAGSDLVSELAMTIDGMDDIMTKGAADQLMCDVVAHGTTDVLGALLARLLGTKATPSSAPCWAAGAGDNDGGSAPKQQQQQHEQPPPPQPQLQRQEHEHQQRVLGTAMWLAGKHGRVDVITMLLQLMTTTSSGNGGEGGVNVRNAAYDGSDYSKRRGGWTALHAAADAGHVECVRALLWYGADVNGVVPQRADGGSAEYVVGWNAFGIAAAGQHADVMDELLAVRGVRVVGLGTDGDDAAAAAAGWTALHTAVMRQRTDDVATALTAAADAAAGGGDGVDVRVTDGWAAEYTALHLAAAVGGEAEVRQLVAAGADVGAGGWWRGTALGVAVVCGRVGVLRVLVELGADVNVHGDETTLTAAARCGREAAVAVLLDMGAAIDRQDGTGFTALHWAMEYKRDAVARLLIARRADVTVADGMGCLPMAMAARCGNVAGVAMLCAAGADVNAAGIGGWTALIWASSQGHVDVVCELLRRGADATTRCHRGDDAMAQAKVHRHWDVVSVLAKLTQWGEIGPC